ncbi:50S ribosomal protein L10 [Candidatus Mycoplasma haematohominis]|uniref:Large ribosomal subunit protein uL10 n=1 Tax=Candidatus Mycoplasma haematohominis TaxID=1494318 RepID=A0A478FR16_9MOLU|nr:50S ribosomal protein L10 [Candidatus Mycoplasma haemohominis]
MGNRTKEIIQRKADEVSLLSKDIKEFGSFLVFEYLGLNSEEISTLRRKVRESKSKLIVHKNNILNRTFKELKLGNSEEMTGSSAILLTNNDIKPFQDVIKLTKEKDFLKLKLAYFDNEVIEKENLKLLSSLGSKEDLLVRLSQTLLSPLYKLTFLIKNVEKQ